MKHLELNLTAIERRLSAGLDPDAEAGALPPEWRDAGGESIMHVAAKSGLPLLLAASCRLFPELAGARDHFGFTPLMAAAGRGQTACVELLLPISDIEARSQSGLGALHMAAGCPSAEAMRLLAARGADPRAPNGRGASLLHMAASRAGLPGAEEALDCALAMLGEDPADANGFTAAQSLAASRAKGARALLARLEHALVSLEASECPAKARAARSL